MSEKIKKPKQKGVCKVPVVMQLEALECGAASLTMVLAYYGKWIPLEQVRSDCGVSRDGSNAKNILMAARFYGLKATAYRYEPQLLMSEGKFPCIIHWNFNHFVVLDGFKGNKAYINDPAKGAYSVPLETFDQSFTGICLMFEPGENFQPGGEKKSTLEFAKKRIQGAGTAMMFTLATGIIASLMGVVSPAFSRIFLDRIITHKNPGWAMPFFVFLFAFSAIQIIVAAIQSVYNRRIDGKMAAVGNSTYMWKVLNLPINFFSQRMAGDIQSRQASNASIANTLINTLVPLVLNSFMLVFYFVVMLRFSPLLTLVGISSLSINTMISIIISKKRMNVTRVIMRDMAKLESTAVSGIEMIETIKSAGAENGFFKKWSGYQASVNAQKVKFEKINRYLGMIPGFVSEIANYIVLVLGIYLVMNGKFTVGMVMAFQGLLTSFMGPAQSLLGAGETIQEMRTQMERIDDVMEYPSDDVFLDENIQKIQSDSVSEEDQKDEETVERKLTGDIEIKNITFGYSPLAEPLIKDFSLQLKPGRSVALVGFSGCGKSTISKLISGLYKPWSGEILFDGKHHNEIRKSLFTSSVAVVDQDIILFEDTIANNIKMWDDSIEDFEMILAARDAQLHEDIMKRPMGYQHKLIEGGKDFSGGQRQRMEIARVLAQDPTIIIMDEATSALDSKTEYEVVKAIQDRGITCIIVAHRLSTIRSCDEIIVLQDGEVIDRGTHEELFARCDLYNDLVTSE